MSDDNTDALTLSTEQVRRMVGVAPVAGLRDWQAEFDRWLAAHDAALTAPVMALHHPATDDYGTICGECGDPDYPCKTVRALGVTAE